MHKQWKSATVIKTSDNRTLYVKKEKEEEEKKNRIENALKK